MVFELNETKSIQEEFQRFLDEQKVETYTLGDHTGTVEGDMEMYTDLKIKSDQEKGRINKFDIAKKEAFNELAKKHDDERIALGQEWQTYEDDNYTIPQ